MKYEVFPNSCRTCLRKCKKLRPICRKAEGGKALIEMLELITGNTIAKVVDTHEWPKNICKSCELSLNLAFKFRSKALRSQKVIELYYNRQKLRDDNMYLDAFAKKDKSVAIKVETPVRTTETTATEEETIKTYSEIKVEDLEIPFSDNAKIDYFTDGNNDDDYNAIDATATTDKSIRTSQQQEQVTPDAKNVDVYADSSTNSYSTKILEDERKDLIPDSNSIKVLKNFKHRGDKNAEKIKIAIEKLSHNINLSKEVEITPISKLLKKKSGRPKINDESGHICDICGNIYAKRGRMMEHRRRHDKELRFACEFCDKRFHIREKLRKHMFSHSGGKPFRCSFCSRTFFYESVKRAHEAVHNGVKPYICEVCQKAFAYSHALKKHKLIHADIKLYHCEYCDKDFRLQHHMKQHEESKLHQNAVKSLEKFSCTEAS